MILFLHIALVRNDIFAIARSPSGCRAGIDEGMDMGVVLRGLIVPASLGIMVFCAQEDSDEEVEIKKIY